METRPLDERTAIITGASSGIGAATARTLAGAGAPVVLAARRRGRLDALRDEIESAGGRALVVPTDVTHRSEVEALADAALDAFGRIDVLVNNAGVMPLAPLKERRVEEWERTVDVNVKGVLYAVAAVLPAMLEQGHGHIVNVGSVAGRRPFPGGTVYSATKFAVRCISAGIHRELSASHGIRVTDIEPGVVDTELPESIEHDESRDAFRERWENRRMLESGDIADAILFAVSAPDRMNVNEILVRPTDQDT